MAGEKKSQLNPTLRAQHSFDIKVALTALQLTSLTRKNAPQSQLYWQPQYCQGHLNWIKSCSSQLSTQQGEGGSPLPLLCPGDAPSAVLHPVLGSPVQER